MEFDRRKAARDLIGSDVRFEIIEWALKQPADKEFSNKDLVAALPHLTNTHQYLGQLVVYEMLSRTMTEPNRPKYRRRASPFWTAFQGIVDAFDQLEKPGAQETGMAQESAVLQFHSKPKRRP